MPLTIDEIIADGSAVAALVSKVKDEVAKLPKPGQPFPADGAAQVAGAISRIVPELGALIDKVRADIAD